MCVAFPSIRNKRLPTDGKPYRVHMIKVGQHYEEHHDCTYADGDSLTGHRIVTFFLYLSEVEGGGETVFTQLGIIVKPRKGMALIWPGTLNSDLSQLDQLTWHQAMPVTKGRKYAANVWFRLRPWRDDVAPREEDQESPEL